MIRRVKGNRVILESPFLKGDPLAVAYAREALLHSLSKGEAPIASHLLYPQALGPDTTPEIRSQGMGAGFVWHRVADRQVVYCDLGISPGMVEGIQHFWKIHMGHFREMPILIRDLGVELPHRPPPGEDLEIGLVEFRWIRPISTRALPPPAPKNKKKK